MRDTFINIDIFTETLHIGYFAPSLTISAIELFVYHNSRIVLIKFVLFNYFVYSALQFL